MLQACIYHLWLGQLIYSLCNLFFFAWVYTTNRMKLYLVTLAWIDWWRHALIRKTKNKAINRQGCISYHFFVPLLFHYWHDESRDNSPLDVQDVDRLIILREEFDISLSFNCDLQRVPVDMDTSSFITWSSSSLLALWLPQFVSLFWPFQFPN